MDSYRGTMAGRMESWTICKPHKNINIILSTSRDHPINVFKNTYASPFLESGTHL